MRHSFDRLAYRYIYKWCMVIHHINPEDGDLWNVGFLIGMANHLRSVKTWNLQPSGTEIKKWRYTLTAPYVSMVWDRFNFNLLQWCCNIWQHSTDLLPRYGAFKHGECRLYFKTDLPNLIIVELFLCCTHCYTRVVLAILYQHICFAVLGCCFFSLLEGTG
jgi:hypothetical protein